MNWLKKTLFSHIIDETWLIRVHRSGTWGFVEITDHKIWKYQPRLYFDLLEDILSTYKMVALSQKIDIKQWRVADREQFVSQIQQHVSAEIKLTSNFNSITPPKNEDGEFVIGIFTPFIRNLWEQTCHFGMFNLPNISFAFNQQVLNWGEEISRLNEIAYSWFHLKVKDGELIKLLERAELICLTIDGHLWFCMKDETDIDRLLASVEKLAKARFIKVVTEPIKMPVGKTA